MSERILVSDVGSTTTKLLLLERGAEGLKALGNTEVGTTVEKPVEDVCRGFFKGVRKLEKITGVELSDGEGKLAVPFLTTSSAGGGLQILVIGLASSDTGTIAGTVAYTAGGVILDSFAIDDDMPRVEKIRRMKHLSPDLVVMAGGYEGGAIAGVVNMAQLVAIAHPKPKFGGDRLPLVFCGNTKARPFVEAVLKDHFDITWADNIRPDGLNFTLKPAVEKVHELFMDHVMQMAPGYSRLLAMTSAPILPTPAGVERILSLYAESRKENIVMADMGGATTDIFSNVGGQFQRTVAANTGMSYSLSNIISEAGPESVFGHIPHIDYETAENWVLGKTLFPTIVPDCPRSADVESAAAAEGMSLAWRHHLKISYKRMKVGFTERMRTLNRCKFDEAFKTVDEMPFRVSDISVIIGAGGIMAHTDPRRAAWILVSGFRPKGLTSLMVDRQFQSPHMGVLSERHREESLMYWEEQCLTPVARVYAPVKKRRKLRFRQGGTGKVVRSGECVYLEDPSGVEIHGVEIPDDGIPLVIDMRFGEERIPLDFRREPIKAEGEIRLPFRKTGMPVEGDVRREFSLSYRGETRVEEGARINAGDTIGVNMLIPPRVFFVDIRGALGYDRQDLTDEQVMEGITVSPGDTVSTGDTVFSIKKGKGLASHKTLAESPVRGVVSEVKQPGLIILKEIQDYDGKPHFVNVARLLGVKPKRIVAYLKVRVGDFVQLGQEIAVGEKLKRIKSPATGSVLDIDRKTGIVKIQYVLEPVELKSPMAGLVEKVDPGMSAVLTSPGVTLDGVVGFGPVRWGPLTVKDPEKGSVFLTCSPLTHETIVKCRESGVAGVIAPSLTSDALVDLLGGEPGVILTGDENIPFSLIVLRGIGRKDLGDEVCQALAAHEGSNCVLFTTTRIRAGVERPMILIQPEGS